MVTYLRLESSLVGVILNLFQLTLSSFLFFFFFLFSDSPDNSKMLVMHRQLCSYLSFLSVIHHFPAFSISIYPISTYTSAESGHCTNPWTMSLHVAQLFDTWAVFLECPEILCTSPIGNFQQACHWSLPFKASNWGNRLALCFLLKPAEDKR